MSLKHTHSPFSEKAYFNLLKFENLFNMLSTLAILLSAAGATYAQATAWSQCAYSGP